MSAEAEMMNPEELAKADWSNEESSRLPEVSEVMAPFAWKILVMPMRPASISKGGVLIPTMVTSAQVYLNYVGRIVSLGPLAYKHSKYAAMGMKPEDMPKRGDWVIYPIYGYQRIDFKGTKLILLNDDSFLGIVPEGVSPWDFKLEK